MATEAPAGSTPINGVLCPPSNRSKAISAYSRLAFHDCPADARSSESFSTMIHELQACERAPSGEPSSFRIFNSQLRISVGKLFITATCEQRKQLDKQTFRNNTCPKGRLRRVFLKFLFMIIVTLCKSILPGRFCSAFTKTKVENNYSTNSKLRKKDFLIHS